MADLTSISAFAAQRLPASDLGVSVHEHTGLAVANVMARKGQTAALQAAIRDGYGITLQSGPRCSGNDALALLGIGPGRWLAVHSAPPSRFVAGLARQLDGVAAVVDQSAAYGVLRLGGPTLIETLAKGVAIDLDDRMFPTGSVAVTQIAHIGATLWKIDDSPVIDVAVSRSLSGSFWHWLAASAAIS